MIAGPYQVWLWMLVWCAPPKPEPEQPPEPTPVK